MDHDRLFKELLSMFFLEFVELFLPEVSAALDRTVADVPKHEVDVLMKAWFQGEEAFFLVHIENQARAQSDFPKRGFYWGQYECALAELPPAEKEATMEIMTVGIGRVLQRELLTDVTQTVPGV